MKNPGWLLSAILIASCGGADSDATLTLEAEVGRGSTSHFLLSGTATGDEALLISSIGWQELYDKIAGLGAAPGNNLIVPDLLQADWKNLLSEGEDLDMTVEWIENGARRSLALDEFLTVQKVESGGVRTIQAPPAMRFTGNTAEQASRQPGHRLCLASCPYSVVSNGGLPFSAGEDHRFLPASDFPPAGMKVQISMGVRAGVRGGVRGGVRAFPSILPSR